MLALYLIAFADINVSRAEEGGEKPRKQAWTIEELGPQDKWPKEYSSADVVLSADEFKAFVHSYTKESARLHRGELPSVVTDKRDQPANEKWGYVRNMRLFAKYFSFLTDAEKKAAISKRRRLMDAAEIRVAEQMTDRFFPNSYVLVYGMTLDLKQYDGERGAYERTVISTHFLPPDGKTFVVQGDTPFRLIPFAEELPQKPDDNYHYYRGAKAVLVGRDFSVTYDEQYGDYKFSVVPFFMAREKAEKYSQAKQAVAVLFEYPGYCPAIEKYDVADEWEKNSNLPAFGEVKMPLILRGLRFYDKGDPGTSYADLWIDAEPIYRFRTHHAFFGGQQYGHSALYVTRTRTWTDQSGKYKVRAKFIEEKDGKVVLRRLSDGKEMGVPKNKLSAADRRIINKFK